MYVKHNRKQWKTFFSIISYLQTTHYHSKLDFQKVDQHTGGKWLFHGTQHRKDNELQSLEPPVEYPGRESKRDIQESEGNMFNPIFKGNVQGRKHPGRCAFAEPEILSFRKPKRVVQNKNYGHKIHNNNHKYHDEKELYHWISKRNR